MSYIWVYSGMSKQELITLDRYACKQQVHDIACMYVQDVLLHFFTTRRDRPQQLTLLVSLKIAVFWFHKPSPTILGSRRRTHIWWVCMGFIDGMSLRECKTWPSQWYNRLLSFHQHAYGYAQQIVSRQSKIAQTWCYMGQKGLNEAGRMAFSWWSIFAAESAIYSWKWGILPACWAI